MLLIFIASATLFLKQSNATSALNHADQVTANALAQAKEALLGRAATNGNLPGSLSCPDTDIDDGDGVANGNFGNCTALVGRLPWKTLDLSDLRDGNGERLWYAIAFKLRDHVSSPPINPLQALPLTLDGAPNIAAIIFSPGAPLANQHGRPSNNVADYLDGSNSDGDTNYVSGLPSATFNDKVLAITRDELFKTVNQRILAEIRGPDDSAPAAPSYGLRSYHASYGFFPWADVNGDGFGDAGTTTGGLPFNEVELHALPTPLPPYNWLSPNGWLPLLTYQRLSPNLARIGISGSSNTMNVIPCPSSPCP
jgi:hypothetical protein